MALDILAGAGSAVLVADARRNDPRSISDSVDALAEHGITLAGLVLARGRIPATRRSLARHTPTGS